MPITIRAPQPTDRQDWDRLYQGYAAFYKVTQTAAMRDTVWSWLMADSPRIHGRVAMDDSGRLMGLAHFRSFARPLSASTGGFLDDLFVDPEARGQNIAAALIEAVRSEAAAQGWSVLRWITAEDNRPGRAVYDRVATKTAWVTYDIKL